MKADGANRKRPRSLVGHGVPALWCPGAVTVETPLVRRDESRSLHLRLGPSPLLILGLAAIHLGAAACTLASDLPAPLAWPVAVAVLGLAVRSIALHAACRADRAIVHLSWDGDGHWRLVERDGRVVDALATHAAYSHAALVALAFRCDDGRSRRVLLVADRVDAETFRRLRVRLRCEGVGLEAGDARPLC